MSERTGWILALIGGLLFLVFMLVLEVQGFRRQEIRGQEIKRQALEDAKNGWVYVCGWNCRWERIKP